jgi:hypothetical protein
VDFPINSMVDLSIVMLNYHIKYSIIHGSLHGFTLDPSLNHH